jgi:hypothetical protein
VQRDEAGLCEGDHKRAHRLLENLAHRLESAHPGAAGSLREGLEETLTMMRLDLPENLARMLSSTNLIENLFSRVRDTARRVKRWQGGTMILRWPRPACSKPSFTSARSPAIVRCPNSSPRCAHMILQSIVNVELKTEKELPK